MPGPLKRLVDRIRARRDRRRAAAGPGPAAPDAPPPGPNPQPTSASMGLLGVLWLLWRNRRLIAMTRSKLFSIIGAIGLLCGAAYNAITLKDFATASAMFSAAMVALGIGKDASVARGILDSRVETPPGAKPIEAIVADNASRAAR